MENINNHLFLVYACTIVQAQFNHLQVTTLNCKMERAGISSVHKVYLILSAISKFFTFGRR